MNNAGIERTGAIEETPLADFRTCMETNYFGAIRCIQAVIRTMRERGSGVIINVTSVAGKICRRRRWGRIRRVEVCVRSSERSPGAGIEGVWRASGNCRTWHHRDADGPQYRGYGGVENVSASSTARCHVREDDAAGAGQPQVVAEKIREIVESGTWQLRHPVGPDAEPFLSWRGSMSDEQWVQWGAQGRLGLVTVCEV